MTSYLKNNQSKSNINVNAEKQDNAATTLMYLLLTVAFLRESAMLFGITAVSTLFYYAMIGIVALICGLTLVSIFYVKVQTRHLIQFLTGVAVCVFLLLTNVLNKDFSFSENGIQMIGIMLLTLFLCCEWIIPINKKLVDSFLWFNFATSIILALNMLRSSNYLGSELIFNYASTNQAGISTMLVSIQLFLQFLVYKKRNNYFICSVTLIMFFVMFVACYLTKSRACLLSVILFLLIVGIFGSNKKSVRIISVLLMTLSLLFPLFWVMFFELLGGDTTITVFGKPLFSGREGLWITIIESIFTTPFSLHITELVSGSVIEHSAHNAFWELIWCYTIWFALVYFGFVASKVTDAYRSVKGKLSLAFFAALIILFFHMCFETAMISGAVNFTIKAFMIISIMRGVYEYDGFEGVGSSTGLQRSKYLR